MPSCLNRFSCSRCKGLWSGPDCSDCSGHTTSEGECSDTADTPSDTTNVIPIVIPLLLAGLGGLGSIPCIACISCKCKKMCKRRRKPKINVHVIHKDMEKNGEFYTDYVSSFTISIFAYVNSTLPPVTGYYTALQRCAPNLNS